MLLFENFSHGVVGTPRADGVQKTSALCEAGKNDTFIQSLEAQRR